MGLLERCGRTLVLLTVTGCSLINDSSVTQCETDDDCLTRFGNDVGVSCLDNFCVQPACKSDMECKARGERYASSVCNMSGVCASSSSSSAGPDASESAPDASEPVLDASQAAADASQPVPDAGPACTTVADCKSLSPTVACNAGVCEDLTWGCAGKADERPPAQQPTATLQGKVLDLSTRMPVSELIASACQLPTFDPDCTRPFPGTKTNYDFDAGMLTLTGVPQDTQVRIKIDFPEDAGLLPLDQYTARTARDLTTLPTLVTQPFALSPRLTLSLDPPRIRDPANASITAVVLDCQNRPAVGVQIRIAESDRITGTEVFYFAEDGQIVQNATKTIAFGSALIINVKPAKLITLQTWAGDLKLNEFRVMGFPRRSTAVSFFPRVYPDLAAGGV
jgi:hypothetical protein